ncbi:MAG: hypothetical protein SVT56_12965, partial [Chloroflexota bacterium]|nr:hypothetical protein [Chloroflexota bacterium]
MAWAGDGLLHELDSDLLPRAGRTFRAGFATVTLLSVTPLEDDRRPWRLVAGRSLRTDEWPLAVP